MKRIGVALGGGGAKGLSHIPNYAGFNRRGQEENFPPPDIYVKPALTNIRVLDFYRYQEILTGVQDEVQGFKETLENLI